MFSNQATISLRKVDGSIYAIDIEGGLTSAAESLLMDSYTRAIEECANAILLNFNQLSYMNSSGIGLLVTMLIKANRQGRRLAAVGLKEHFVNIFRLTKLNESIPVYARENEALEGLLNLDAIIEEGCTSTN